MTRKYWLDLFTGTTWEEFLEHGAKISGFSASRKRLAERISPGDYLLCYLTGISRFIGILEVKSKCYEDATPIWKADIFATPAHIEGLGPGRIPDILRRHLRPGQCAGRVRLQRRFGLAAARLLRS